MNNWAADNAQRRKVSDLVAYARNARTHTEDQVRQIAASVKRFGWTSPVLVRDDGGIIAGHGRVRAAELLGLEEVPVVVAHGWTDDEVRAYVIADNKLAENAGWDRAILSDELRALDALGDFDLGVIGFSDKELAELLTFHAEQSGTGLTDADAVPEVQADPVSQRGDVWWLGAHRVMCGDSTSADDVARLMSGKRAALMHADPPYGMGKEADGVLNDNLYNEKLDRFQLQWWRAFRPFLIDNASAYVWGNAADLWRLWYAAGLGATERFEMRNEIVWDKKNIAGMASPDLTQYPIASERCLFFQFGNQFLGNVNVDEFPERWEPLRAYMQAQAEAANVKPSDIKRVCGCGMFGHWFTRAQFTLIPEKHYRALQTAYPDAFQRPWSELAAEWQRVRGAGRAVINEKQDAARSYFDNAHDVMRDVWEFPRVSGEERFGHATPKPVAMIERVLRSSLPDGGLCVDPFAGSGSTLIAAQRSARVCFTMELTPIYVDVTVRRWQEFTGSPAVLEGSERTFEEIEQERRALQRAEVAA